MRLGTSLLTPGQETTITSGFAAETAAHEALGLSERAQGFLALAKAQPTALCCLACQNKRERQWA